MSVDTPSSPAGLIWEEPPDTGRGGQWPPVAAALRSNPGKWAKLPSDLAANANTAATTIRSAGVTSFAPRGAFEAAVRKGEVYARYVGEPAA